jgi:hypothetical protein
MNNLVNIKRLSKLVIPVVLALSVAASLWVFSPKQAEALQITFPSLPSSGTLGNIYSFTIKIDVESADLRPLTSADLIIRSVTYPSYNTTCSNLPMTNGGSQTYPGSFGTVSVTATTDANWGYGYASSRYGYGYTEPGGGWGYYDNLSGGYGYGYGTGSSQGATSITYSVNWTSSSNWPDGTYNVKAIVYFEPGRAFSATGTFTLTRVSGGGGGGGGGGGVTPTPTPGINNVTGLVNSEGVFTASFTAQSEDGRVQLLINSGVTGKTRDGRALSQISMLRMSNPPAPPADTSFIGLVYDIGPDGATFNPPITLTFTYDPALIPIGLDPNKMGIAFWDSATSKWVMLEGATVNTAMRTISVPISHFTPFAIIAQTRPASFAVSQLSITPAEVNAGEPVTITVRVSNSGDLAGTYKITFKINDAIVATRDVSIAGGTSEFQSFTTTQDVIGTYSVDINGMTGTFTVKVQPLPATFTIRDLTVSPADIKVDSSITISVSVTNTGELTGSYTVTLKIDNVVIDTKEISLDAGASEKVSFTTQAKAAGTYTINVNGLTDVFTVRPTEAVSVINWWLIGGIIASVVMLAVIIGLTIRRRQA